MIELPDDKMDQMVKRFEMLESQMAEGPDAETYVKLAGEYSDLEDLVKNIRQYRAKTSEKAELDTMLADRTTDAEMRELAEIELEEVEEAIEGLQQDIQVLLLPKDAADSKSAILEIRAGTGGLEAALFAGNLFRMYERFASENGWKVEVISQSEGDAGGFKEIIATVTGRGVFAKFKFESGVHRVQRVPVTEGGGRIHTSAATVAVLPEPEEVDVEIADKDLRIDVFRASGAGGQHVNKTESAVRITHLPTGIVVSQQDEKSQHKNKARAMQIMRAKLFDAERERIDRERSANRKGQVGSGDRSERIRTYNFPQGRVTDHRINLTLHKLDQVLAGDALGELIDSLIAEDQAARLAAMEDEA